MATTNMSGVYLRGSRLTNDEVELLCARLKEKYGHQKVLGSVPQETVTDYTLVSRPAIIEYLSRKR